MYGDWFEIDHVTCSICNVKMCQIRIKMVTIFLFVNLLKNSKCMVAVSDPGGGGGGATGAPLNLDQLSF